MSDRKHLRLHWENLDEHLFLSACELAEEILASAQDPEARFDLNVNRTPARAELRLTEVLPHREALAQLWQIIKAWRTSHANENMRRWLGKMKDLDDCHRRHASLPALACRVCEDQNLRFAGCKRVLPALGPLDIDRPFEVRLTYWNLGNRRAGGWVFNRQDIDANWTHYVREQGLQYCPRFAGIGAALAELPLVVDCGPDQPWRLVQSPATESIFGESPPELLAIPRDVPLPAGYQKVRA